MSVSRPDTKDYEYVDFGDPTNDRFTTFRAGSYDPRALQYYGRTGTSYGSGHPSNAEVRAALTVDMDLHTGTTELPQFLTVSPRGQWWKGTGGLKLRSFRTQRNEHANLCHKHHLE
jgi:hypothetical protein